MTKKEIEDRITELKSDYVRIQSDLEKMEATVGNSVSGEKHLIEIEDEMAQLRTKLDQLQ